MEALSAKSSPKGSLTSGVDTFGTSGARVLMLHSSMSSRRQWVSLAKRLQSNYRVITIDLFGYGEAPTAPGARAFSLQTEVNRVNSLLDAIVCPGETVHVLGHSYGGAVALRMAHAALNRVASLAVFEPTSFHLLNGNADALHDIERVALLIDSAVELGTDCPALPAHATEVLVDFWGGCGTYCSINEPRKQSLVRELEKINLDFQALFTDKLSLDHFRDLPVPVSLMAGRNSPYVTRQIVAALSRALPWRETRWIEAGHLAPITHAHLVDPIFEQHLDTFASQWPLSAARRLPAIK